jgi:hypothetical protein
MELNQPGRRMELLCKSPCMIQLSNNIMPEEISP